MINKIKVWSSEEAEEFFQRIEAHSEDEWLHLDWKESLNFNSTGTDSNSKNTTQKAICALANTKGGQLVIGFEDKSCFLKGVTSIPDVENHISDKLKSKLHPKVPDFKVKEYEYKQKKVLVIFIGESKEPIMCDNGVFYHREQSASVSMNYNLIERKFRTVFDEEKYIYLMMNDLEMLKIQFKAGIQSNGVAGARNVNYHVTAYCKYFLEASEKLYFFLKENSLQRIHTELCRCIFNMMESEDKVILSSSPFINAARLAEEFETAVKGIIEQK